jgi:hypothetical protein
MPRDPFMALRHFLPPAPGAVRRRSNPENPVECGQREQAYPSGCVVFQTDEQPMIA